MLLSLAVLGLTALAQTVIFARVRQRRAAGRPDPQLRGRAHRGTARHRLPAALRPRRAGAGLFVVAAIFVSACVAGVEAVERLVHPEPPTTCGRSRSPGRSASRATALRRASAPARAAARQPRADRRRPPCARRRLCLAGRDRLGRGHRDRPADRRPADRPRDHRVILRITWQSWQTIQGHDHHHSETPPGTVRPRRFLPRFHYELLVCGLRRARADRHRRRAAAPARTRSWRARSTACAGTAACAATRGCRCPRRRAPARERPPPRDEIELPLRGRPLRDKIVLRLIAVNRALHFVVLGALAVAIFALRRASARPARHRSTACSPTSRAALGQPARRRSHGCSTSSTRCSRSSRARCTLVARGRRALRAARGRRGGRALVSASAGPST